MAKGSEQFAWKLWPELGEDARVCGVCKRKLRVKDVGEHRTYHTYRNGIGYASDPVFWCHNHYGGKAG